MVVSHLTEGIQKMKKILLTAATIAGACLMVAGCAVRQEDLASWQGVPVSALDVHTEFLTMHLARSEAADGTEVRNYVNGPCNNIFYIRDGRVVKYNPVGNCYTDESLQPQPRF
jgi:hypothetical protein